MAAFYYDCAAPAETDPAGKTETGGIYRPWALYQTDYAIPAGATHLSATHRIHVQDAWGNSQGYYLKSHNRNQKDLAFAISPDFLGATVGVEETHVFSHFDTPAAWAKAHADASTFYTHNPGFNGPLTVVQDLTGSYRFTVGSGTGLVKCSLPFKPFAHRFYRLAIWSDGAHTIRVGMGRRPASLVPYAPAYYWEYAWEYALAAGWQTVTIDLMHPTRVSAVAEVGTTGAVVSDAAYTGQRQPHNFLDGADSATTLWLELEAGVYEADYIEGYLDFALNTRPSQFYHGIENTGDSTPLESYEPGALPLDLLRQYLQYTCNGARGFVITQVGASVAQFWSGVRQLLSDDYGSNDTGFIIAPNSHALDTQPVAGAYSIAGFPGSPPYYGWNMSGNLLSPAFVFQRLRRSSTLGLPGYYGMGDPVGGSYDKTNVLHSDTLWNGEARGVLREFTLGGDVELYENPGGTLVATASLADDGSFRIAWLPGVYHPRSNSSAALSSGDPAEYAGSPPVYTAQGEEFASYWLKAPGGIGLDVDGSGYVLQGGQRMVVTILDGYASWFPFSTSQVGRTPANTQDRWGRYHRVSAPSGRIRYVRADRTVPPFILDLDATAGTQDTHPRIVVDQGEQARILFARGSGAAAALETRSNDSGATWTEPALRWSGVKYPTLATCDRFGLVYAFAYDGGALVCRREDAGGSVVTFTLEGESGALVVEDDSFEFAFRDGRGWGAVRLDGEAGVAVLTSTDRGATWKVFAELLAGGESPTLAFGRTGDLVVAARLGGGIRAAVLPAGGTAFGDEFDFVDETDTPLAVAEDTFHLAAAREGERRGVLTVILSAETEASEHVSADTWRTWKRVT